MFKIILLASFISASMATQFLWGQCAGDGYSGETICTSESQCVYINQWYSQVSCYKILDH
jgi:hypothetical protein